MRNRRTSPSCSTSLALSAKYESAAYSVNHRAAEGTSMMRFRPCNTVDPRENRVSPSTSTTNKRQFTGAGLIAICAVSSLLASWSGPVWAQVGPRGASAPGTEFHLQFVNTDVSDVLQAISIKTHASIVYSALLKRPISINMTANSVNEAIGFAAAAAGLTFREMNHRYFVATSGDLKLMIESFGDTAMVNLDGLPTVQAVALLAGAVPYLTVRPAGRQLMLVGAQEDINLAKTLLAAEVRPPAPVEQRSEVCPVNALVAEQAATLLQTLYPDVKAQAVAGAAKVGGAVGLVGPATQVAAARATLAKLDASTPVVTTPKQVYRIYPVKYSQPGSLRMFIQKAMPDITAIIGPEHASPREADFKPLTSALSGGAGGSSPGGSGSGGSGSSGSGSSSGGGATGGSGSGAGADTGGVGKANEGEKATSLVISGLDSNVDLAFKLLAEVDIAPKQVMIEVQVVDISPQSTSNLGVTWNWSSLNALETKPGTALTGSTISSPSTVPLPFGYFSKVPSSIQATVNAMVSHNDAKILATPRIQVLDKDDASIFIGDTLNVEVSQSGISGTTVQVFQFPVGIILLVRPIVNPDGDITMRVHPVVSTITSIGSDNLPQTSSREAETVVRIHDGETVVIGGLIRDEMSKTVQEVPGLSRLPLVGQLFRNTSTSHTKSEIMVFITPHLTK